MGEILNVDAVIVTHIHLDHRDAARGLISKEIQVLVQNENDEVDIQAAGFGNTRPCRRHGV